MIRKAIGLGSMILILKFLVHDVYVASVRTSITALDAASALMSNVPYGNGGAGLGGLDPSSMIPR